MLNLTVNIFPDQTLSLVISTLLTSCGNDELEERTKTSVYEATFINIYSGSVVVYPSHESAGPYLETFLPFTPNIDEEIISWGEGPTTTHDKYHLELSETTAKLSIEISGTGIHKLNKRYKHDSKFTPGEYKDKNDPTHVSYVVSEDKIDIYQNENYYLTLPNPINYYIYGDSPWDEEYTLEVSAENLDLTVKQYVKLNLYNHAA